jgi:hypothetical protein
VNKQTWMHVAELVDAYRIFPRLVLIGYAYYVYQVTFFVLRWYATQPAIARGTEESVVVGVVVTAVTGFAPWIFRIYSDSGRNWDAMPVSTSTTMTSTKVTTPA